MNAQRTLMTVLWLAALGAAIIYGQRLIGNLASKTGV